MADEQKNENELGTKTATDQVVSDSPNNFNPTGKGGFGDHPENRSPGGWKKEGSISYQYNFLIRLNVEQFKLWLSENPEKERTVAQDIAYNAVINSRKDLKYLQEITDRTEGKAPQTISHEGGFFSTNELKIITVDERAEVESETDSDTETT